MNNNNLHNPSHADLNGSSPGTNPGHEAVELLGVEALQSILFANQKNAKQALTTADKLPETTDTSPEQSDQAKKTLSYPPADPNNPFSAEYIRLMESFPGPGLDGAKAWMQYIHNKHIGYIANCDEVLTLRKNTANIQYASALTTVKSPDNENSLLHSKNLFGPNGPDDPNPDPRKLLELVAVIGEDHPRENFYPWQEAQKIYEKYRSSADTQGPIWAEKGDFDDLPEKLEDYVAYHLLSQDEHLNYRSLMALLFQPQLTEENFFVWWILHRYRHKDHFIKYVLEQLNNSMKEFGRYAYEVRMPEARGSLPPWLRQAPDEVIERDFSWAFSQNARSRYQAINPYRKTNAFINAKFKNPRQIDVADFNLDDLYPNLSDTLPGYYSTVQAHQAIVREYLAEAAAKNGDELPEIRGRLKDNIARALSNAPPETSKLPEHVQAAIRATEDRRFKDLKSRAEDDSSSDETDEPADSSELFYSLVNGGLDNLETELAQASGQKKPLSSRAQIRIIEFIEALEQIDPAEIEDLELVQSLLPYQQSLEDYYFQIKQHEGGGPYIESLLELSQLVKRLGYSPIIMKLRLLASEIEAYVTHGKPIKGAHVLALDQLTQLAEQTENVHLNFILQDLSEKLEPPNPVTAEQIQTLNDLPDFILPPPTDPSSLEYGKPQRPLLGKYKPPRKKKTCRTETRKKKYKAEKNGKNGGKNGRNSH